ncbi:hypothetical protein EC968_000864 [Mortierella alpina]|nr:hypothetical protein EC968_000864 [Mortierella alpina]
MPTPSGTSELPPASSKSAAGLGPLDLPPSPDHEQPRSLTEPAGKPIPIPKSSSRADLDMELDEELSRSVSTVESWLKRTNSDMEASALTSAPLATSSSDPVSIEDRSALNSNTSVSGVISTAETTPAQSSSSTAASRIISGAPESPIILDVRRPSHTSTVSTNDEDNNSDSEDIKVPITVLTMGSNRLSRMYETQSLQMAHSHTEELDAQGGSATLSAITATSSIKSSRNSIRFSQYGLLLSKDLPLASQSGLSAFGYSRPDKPLPRRPVSLFMSSSSLASTLTETSEGAAGEAGADGELGLGHSNQHLAVSSPHHGGFGSRPATICISPEMNSVAVTTASLSSTSATTAPPVSPVTVTIRPLSSYVSSLPLHAPAVSLTPAPSPSPPTDVLEATAPQQDETMESLAFKTAKRCWAEDSTFLKRDEISQYLGAGSKPFNRLVLSFYMRHFNFSGKRLDTAFRLLCQKLMLRGETQEVDRVLEQFAARFVECNPESIFGHKDVVHAITYSILLLNTDLHVVKQSNANKMSRSAFVKNTLQVVLAQTEYREEQERQSEDSSAHGLSLSRTGTGELSVHGSGSGGGKRRTPSVKSWKSAASHQSKSSKMGLDPKANGGHGNGKWWIQELEQLLKDIYSTVKHHQILLPLTPRANNSSASAPATPTAGGIPDSSPQNSGRAGPMSSGGASRGYKPAPSNALIDVGFGGLGSGSGAFGGGGGSSSSSVSGGRGSMPGSGENNSGPGSSLGSVLGLGRRNSTNARTRQLRQDAMDRLRAQETGSGAAEDDSGIRYGLAPSISVQDSTKASSMHGTMSSLPPIHTPSSSSSSGHHSNNFMSTPPSPASSILSQRDGIASRRGGYPSSQQQQSHQHKQNLQGKSGNTGNTNNNSRLRKEGILYRKHLLERADKKASNRSWRQLLVVLDQGGLSLFRADGQLGQAIEEQGILFDEIRLQHTITNVLPPPGYSSSRRHVFAIQLFTGAVYLFQAANAVDCEEWAKTCNYWAARTTKEPLPGGVINMDYGWGRSLDMFLQQQQQQQLGQHDGVLTVNNSSNQSVMMLSGNSSGSSLAALATATETSSSSNISLEDTNNDDAKSVNNSMNAGTSFLNHPPPTSGGSVNSSGGSLYGNSGMGSGGRAASIKSTSSKHPHHFGGAGSGASNVSLGDRVVLFEWSVPLPTMSMSMLTEEEQCEALKKYVSGLESDMETHQEHRVPMMKLFLPKSNNYVKAFNNWERRSRHLLKEMVKYQIYVESLEQSLALDRERKLKEEEEVATEQLETELQHLEVEDEDDEEKHKGDVTQET